MLENILNFVYFAVGLLIGLFGIWMNQRNFLAQQQDKFDKISYKLEEIATKMTELSLSISDRAQQREQFLLDHAVRRQTEYISAQTKDDILEELKKPEVIEHPAQLEEKVGQIINKSAEQILTYSKDDNVSLVYKEIEEDKPLRREVEGVFWISNKYFDEDATPQKIVIEFTNSGHDVIRVNTVRYSSTGLGLPKSALVSAYRRDARKDYIIFDDKEEVLMDQKFRVELELGQLWKPKDILQWAGEWGYLKIDVVYKGKSLGLFYDI